MQDKTLRHRSPWTVCPRGVLACLAIIAASAGAHAAAAQPAAGKSTNVGRVTNLRDSADTPAEGNALVGHIYTFDKSADDAFAALRDGEVKEAVDAARNMARAANEIADKVAEGQENLGEAAARIEIADAQFKRLEDETRADPAARQQLAEDLQVFRGILTSRLAALRERYRAIDANDQTQKESVRKQMAAIANRIENFDDIRQTIEQGASAGVPDSATAWMQQQLEDMKIALAEEEAALQLTATAMRTQLADTTREIARSFRMIELQSRLPSEQIRRLQMAQASTKEVLGKLVREHRRATEAVLGIIVKGEDGPAPAENELLERVDRLLGNTRTAPGHNND